MVSSRTPPLASHGARPATSATACDKAFEALMEMRWQPTIRVSPPYYDEPVYIEALANSLRVLSSEFREERMMMAEEKAAKLPAIMTIPMIMFILPSLFITVGGPAIMQVVKQLGK